MLPGFSAAQEQMLLKLRAEADRREFGILAHRRLEFARWLYEHGRIGKEDSSSAVPPVPD